MNKLTYLAALGLALAMPSAHALTDISQTPIFVNASVPPLNMLVMGRDHKLYYEAYNDASDLNGDGVIDVGYKGYLSKEQGGFDYFGYYNSYVCYTYSNGMFVPSTATTNKKCSGTWSGDYLNYLTTSRMDALRKVLYGGYRVTDTTSSTVLQGSYIPQDSHTWGKEYQSLAKDGFLISDYTPLSQPPSGFRHLFASTSLADGGVPQLRVLTNTSFRIWDWVSKERPVAGANCRSLSSSNDVSCTGNGPSTNWALVPAGTFADLTITTWKNNAPAVSNEAGMNTLFDNQSTTDNRCGSGPYQSIQSTNNTSNNNPFNGTNGCSHNNYHTLLTGTFTPSETGDYQFGVDGDATIDFAIGAAGNLTVRASRYGNKEKNNSANGSTGTVYLIAGTTYSVRLRHRDTTGNDSWFVYWKTPASFATSTLTDYNNKVEVCPNSNASLRDGNCTAYSNGIYKPTGILHDYGASNKMYFGLLSGSYSKNMSGGILRSNIQSFQNEYNPTTGQFCASASGVCTHTGAISNGIVDNINKFRIVGFHYSSAPSGAPNTNSYSYSYCPWIADREMSQSDKCYMWGNPIGEMMYETLRYFKGATTPTADYDYTDTGSQDNTLGLAKPTWTPPYTDAPTGAAYPSCSVPAMTVISDINPSFDYKIPGGQWSSWSTASAAPLTNFNVSTQTNAIGASEQIHNKNYFIGQSSSTNYDGAPSSKSVTELAQVRGLAPEEPTRQGTYYSAGVARYGATTGVGSSTGEKQVYTYAVALASPLPKIDFRMGSSNVTVVPFAKTVGGGFSTYNVNTASSFRPTNSIADFYVEQIANTDPSGSDSDPNVNGGRAYMRFRINFEDQEQGADFDTDALVTYTLQATEDGRLNIALAVNYRGDSWIQNIGYVISGTGTASDGVYLDVCASDDAKCGRTGNTPSSASYFSLNTPPDQPAGYCVNNSTTPACYSLPASSSRYFTPAANAQGAGLLNNPLWYAAKYGIPGRDVSRVEGDPDNYFLVTNAMTLKDQLDKAFSDLSQRNTSVAKPAVGREPQGTGTTDNDQFVYRTEFDVSDWSGVLLKEKVAANGTLERVWTASIPAQRNIMMANATGNGLVDFDWDNLDGRTFDGILLRDALNKDRNEADATVDNYGEARVQFIKGENCTLTGCSTFRTRTTKLGDIIGSNPVLVKGAQYLTYAAEGVDGAAGAYAAFKAAQQDRPAMIYVGANDGMLHAFDAATGAETFAFVPTAVIPKLNRLTATDYTSPAGENHQYYVDGSLISADVYMGDEWRTVLVGTLGAGGREVFALDITDPENIDLLWEFTTDSPASKNCTDDVCQPSDLGYSIPTPVIARLHDGNWGVVFGNGYNSPNESSGRATLFILNISDGSLIAKLDAQGDSGTNGLSSPRLADNNSDGVADYAYAGDLQGNMWRFDLFNTALSTTLDSDRLLKVASPSGTAASQFRVSFGGAPIYTARTADSDGVAQPITAPPSLVRHPSRVGYIVAFGTGTYLGTSDKVAPYRLETLYGIWDRNTKGQLVNSTPLLNRSNLRQQTITNEYLNETFNKVVGDEIVSSGTWDARLISQNALSWYSPNNEQGKHGWYLDLVVSGGELNGERIVDEMVKRGDVLIFSTRIPSANPCESGIDGFLYAIDPATGGRTRFNVFDLNKDGRFDSEDQKNNTVVSGIRASAGGFTFARSGSGTSVFGPDGSKTPVNVNARPAGRQSWQVIGSNPPTAADEEETETPTAGSED